MTKKYADAQKFCQSAAINGFTIGRLVEPKTQSFNDKVQSHYIIVAKGEIFIEKNMRFELVLGWLAILKKMGDDY